MQGRFKPFFMALNLFCYECKYFISLQVNNFSKLSKMITYEYKKVKGYEQKKFIENGHTMFESDVLQRLQRLAFLEIEIKKKKNLSGCEFENGSGYCDNNSYCKDKCHIENTNSFSCMRAL